jgi:hypothetical protein
VTARRELLADAGALFAIKTGVSLAVLAMGFTHISDDDYSRTVIAQLFAHSPKLDPSGTSWLPFPFWVNGLAMMIFGRSLIVARVVAILLSSLAATAPYLGARALDVKRAPAFAGAVIASCTPLCAWLGAATVPEGFTGLLTAGAIMAIARAPIPSALALLAASLSRYETWPVCAVAGIALAIKRPRDFTAIVLVIIGPIAWMVWNRFSHGSFFHFFARVSAFREAHATPAPFSERLFGNPIALAVVFPEAILAVTIGVLSWRKYWSLPLLAALATLLFLIVGDLSGGAPTHHPERALVMVAACMVMFGADAVRNRHRVYAGALALWVVFAAYRSTTFSADDRREQIARGVSLRSSRALDVTPCAYEHFALMAAYGAPENVRVHPAAPSDVCPVVSPE